jgi:hypothetical protein
MAVQRGSKQAQPVHEQFRRKAGHRMLVGHLIWLIPIWTSAKRHSPETGKGGLCAALISYDFRRSRQRGVFLHTVIEGADDSFDLIESYIGGNIAHYEYVQLCHAMI